MFRFVQSRDIGSEYSSLAGKRLRPASSFDLQGQNFTGNIFVSSLILAEGLSTRLD
jgi:hypothetical protein